jgi:Zn-dependent protease with chaperone function
MRLNTATKLSRAVRPASGGRAVLPLVASAVLVGWLAAVPGWAAPAAAGPQLIKLPQKLKLDKVVKRAEQLRDLQVTQDEELQLGAEVSARVRDRYGVVQDEAVHRYVTLVGTLLVKKSARPGLPFRFIVLDTDGVNAFAAPGGFIHITRGALGLMSSEAELAGVLAHEISHVTEKHTIRAIQKNKVIQITADESITKNAAIWHKLVDATSDLVMAGFGRGEELESDLDGLAIADAAGYSPRGLGEFLRRLGARNQSTTGKQGLFASHPEMNERLEALDREIKARKYASTAVLAGRFKSAIPYTAKPVTEIATVEAGSSGLAGGGGTTKPADTSKKSGFSLSTLLKPAGTEKKSAEVTGSGASRGVDTERNARGGAEKSMVTVRVTAAELEAFRKEGNLKP